MPKFFLPSTLTKVTTMADKGLRLIFDAQETSPAEDADIMRLKYKFGVLFFTDNKLEEVPEVPPVPKVEGYKSASQRLRAALYREWEETQEGQAGLMTNEEHYQSRMEKIISDVLEKLPEPFKEE